MMIMEKTGLIEYIGVFRCFKMLGNCVTCHILYSWLLYN